MCKPTHNPPACPPQHGASQDVSGVYSTATLGDATGAESTASESARGSVLHWHRLLTQKEVPHD